MGIWPTNFAGGGSICLLAVYAGLAVFISWLPGKSDHSIFRERSFP
jgi:hypothetical protein